jgi:hypothetical protein
MFQEAARSNQQRWIADKRNLAALETLSLAEDSAGDIWEEFGDLAQAQRLRQSAYAHAAALLHADNATAANRNRVRASRVEAVRGLWLMAGDRGDYRAFFENADPSGEQIRAVLAESWTDRANLISTFGTPVTSRLEASRMAIDLSSALATASPSTSNRLGLAHSLQSEGDGLHAAARASSGTESANAYRRSQEQYLEALKILNSLKESGILPSTENPVLVDLTNSLASAGEGLHPRPENAVSHR